MEKTKSRKSTQALRKLAVKRIAIITYNRIGDGQYDNGLMNLPEKNLELYIAQNGHRTKWAASEGNDAQREETRHRAAHQAVEYAERYVGDTGLKSLDELDHLYLYVGSNGGEDIIRLTKGLSADKVTYVMCGCNFGYKKGLINEQGNASAEIMDCECGGQRTLDKILRGLLN